MRNCKSDWIFLSLLALFLLLLACTACGKTAEQTVFEERSPRQFFLTARIVADCKLSHFKGFLGVIS